MDMAAFSLLGTHKFWSHSKEISRSLDKNHEFGTEFGNSPKNSKWVPKIMSCPKWPIKYYGNGKWREIPLENPTGQSCLEVRARMEESGFLSLNYKILKNRYWRVVGWFIWLSRNCQEKYLSLKSSIKWPKIMKRIIQMLASKWLREISKP